MFLSIALVLRAFFSADIPLFGASGIRIGPHSIFVALPAFLYGPFYGALVAALADFLGFVIRPSGPSWLPFLTLNAAIGGFVRGVLWSFLANKKTPVLRCVCVGVCLGGGALGAALSELALVITGILAAFLLILDGFLNKFLKTRAASLPVLLAMLVSAALISTLNTIFLRFTVFAEVWELLPFWAIWTPRITVALASAAIYAYVITVILETARAVKILAPKVKQ